MDLLHGTAISEKEAIGTVTRNRVTPAIKFVHVRKIKTTPGKISVMTGRIEVSDAKTIAAATAIAANAERITRIVGKTSEITEEIFETAGQMGATVPGIFGHTVNNNTIRKGVFELIEQIDATTPEISGRIGKIRANIKGIFEPTGEID